MDAAAAGLLGAGAGALAGLVGGVLAGWQQRLGERQRWHLSRIDEIRKVERDALVSLTTQMARAFQAIAWLSWSASAKPLEEVKTEVDFYNNRMRDLLPMIFSAQAAASGLDKKAYARMQALVDRLIDLDTEIGTRSARLEENPAATCEALRPYEEIALKLQHDLVQVVREALQST